jgi:hypothetical protein
MPLRDHFRPPLDDARSWEELHGQWPAMIVVELSRKLPPRYVAAPRVHLGAAMEIDVSTFEEETPAPSWPGPGADEGGVATAVWAPPRPTFAVVADLPDQDEYEARVYDTNGTAGWSRPSRSSAPATRTGPKTAARS